jgi:hypothetical protein
MDLTLPSASTVDLQRLNLSHRLRPVDDDHVTAIAHVLDDCPPITVQRHTLRLVDGHMRVAAAQILGRVTLPVTWVNGNDADLLELAAARNASHGLPLTLGQRKDAALKLLQLAPDYSNRRIATACGISETTVRRLRRPPASPTHLDNRSGADGKTYSVDTAPARTAATTMLTTDPQLSDRAVARLTGLSPTTVGRLRRDLAPDVTPEPTEPRHRPLRRRFWSWIRRILGMSASP